MLRAARGGRGEQREQRDGDGRLGLHDPCSSFEMVGGASIHHARAAPRQKGSRAPYEGEATLGEDDGR
jgi:hypothetical protein